MNAQVKPQVTIGVERYSDALIEEMKPLLKRNWWRSESHTHDFDLDPNFETYKRMDAAGKLLALFARLEGRLVGYIVYFVAPSTHHKTILAAHGDIIYVEDEPALARVAGELLERSEAMLREQGVQVIGWFTNSGSRLHRLLKVKGHKDDEIVTEKWLCARLPT